LAPLVLRYHDRHARVQEVSAVLEGGLDFLLCLGDGQPPHGDFADHRQRDAAVLIDPHGPRHVVLAVDLYGDLILRGQRVVAIGRRRGRGRRRRQTRRQRAGRRGPYALPARPRWGGGGRGG